MFISFSNLFFNYVVKFEGKINSNEWISVWDEVKNEIPKISKEIKKEFQEIMEDYGLDEDEAVELKDDL